jgi:signal transduction histidine kinase
VTFRGRLLVTFVGIVVIPTGVLAFGVRREMRGRLTAQYRDRVASVTAALQNEVEREGANIARRLSAIGEALEADNRFRLGAVQEVQSQRSYVLDYAANAMQLAGLDLLQIQDDAGRIVTSGHFRNAFDQIEPDLPRLVTAVGVTALVEARAPDSSFLALARIDSVQIGSRRFTLTGGLRADSSFWGRLVFDEGPTLRLELDGETQVPAAAADPSGRDVTVGEVRLPFAALGATETREARLLVVYDLTPLAQLLRGVDQWFLAAVGITVSLAVLIALWLARRIGRPVAQLAAKTARIDLDRLDVDFSSNRQDELGDLSRLLGEMAQRLRESVSQLRETERRATLGDLARQVNHDIKNGLIPVRNVLHHLSEVAHERPQELPTVFAERRSTLDSGITYLETLAANYARLTPRSTMRSCNANGVISELLRDMRKGSAEIRARLADDLLEVESDPVLLRRVLENLIGNAVDSIGDDGGTVTVTTAQAGSLVRIEVRDTGPGMTKDQLEHAFEDFYTTKHEGTGLGLSVVRRLILDLKGTLRVETEPGTGSNFVVELPASRAAVSAPSEEDQT